MSIGRPLSITDEISDGKGGTVTKGAAILQAIKLGVPREVAANAAGVHVATFYRWVAQGAEYDEMEDHELTDDQRVLRDFREELSRADANAVVYAVAMVRKAMPDDWRAAMTFLERRYPGEWGKRLEIAVDPVERRPAPVDQEQLDRAAAAFAAVGIPEGLEPGQVLTLPEADVTEVDVEE